MEVVPCGLHRRYLPQFRTICDEKIGQQATLVDLCSHATGLASLDHAIIGFHNEFYNQGVDQVTISSHLPIVSDFQSRFIYNNHMYGLVGEVIRRVCGKSLGSVMKEKIFQPLGLLRTVTSAADYPTDGNIAMGYSVMDDGSLLPLGDPKLEDGSPQDAAGFVRSTVNDMLCWAKALMEAETRQRADFAIDDEILSNIAFTRIARLPITTGSTAGENSYGMGWFRHKIPSQWLGSISPNFVLLPIPPVIGQDSPSRLTISHYGAVGGFLASFYTFPETCSAIIVMANSSPSRGDPTDLIAQALCQELFDMRPRIPLDEFALQAAKTSKLIWPSVVHEWVLARRASDINPNIIEYIGCYRNADLALHLEVFELVAKDKKSHKKGKRSPELMAFSVNGKPSQTANLRHYHQDVWTFLPDSRDDASRKGMEMHMRLPAVLLFFGRDALGCISWLEWDLYSGMYNEPDSNQVAPIKFQKL